MYLLPVALITLLPATLAWSPRQGPGSGSQSNECSQAVVALAAGIHLNIVGQHAEYNGTLAVLAVESKTPVNQEAFLLAKGQLLSDIQGGMNIRLFNQQIAPPGNAAISGLAKYASAQQTEQQLAEGLTGDPSTDASALSSLKSDIMAGIKLNENNLQKVRFLSTRSRCAVQ
jgi:hypothetical protein